MTMEEPEDSSKRLRLTDAIKVLIVLSEGRKTLAELAKIFGATEPDMEEDLDSLGWNRLVRKESEEARELYAISEVGIALLHNWSEIWRKMRV